MPIGLHGSDVARLHEIDSTSTISKRDPADSNIPEESTALRAVQDRWSRQDRRFPRQFPGGLPGMEVFL
jgi:hypothetical protein